MKKITPLLFILTLCLTLTLCLYAADFWQTKPYTDWSDKELEKIETNSPWSKQVFITPAGGSGGPNTARGKHSSSGASGDLDSTLGSGTTGSGGRGNTSEVGGGMVPAATPTMSVVVSWRTALPVRQAVVKQKFGSEVATSADAKKMLEEEQKFYGIMISGLPGRALRGGEKMKDALLQNTALIVKGKDPIQATDVKTGGNEQRTVVVFLFPKTAPFTLEDKDVEFSSKLGSIVVKQKFHLKDMVVNGKLDL